MSVLNWVILIMGLLLISVLWLKISPAERKKETKIVAGAFIALGIIVYFIQSTFL